MTFWRVFSLLVVLAAGGGVYFYKKKSPPVALEKNTIKRGDLIQRVSMSGVVAPRRKSIVYAPYKGIISKLFVEVGSIVRAGDPLVLIEETTQASTQPFPLRATISGTVVQIEKNVGEPLRGDQDQKEFILRIDDLSSMRVLAATTELDRVKIKKGMDVSIRVVAISGKTFAGRIESMDLAAREGDQSGWNSKGRVEFQVKASIDSPDANIRSGMGVMMDVITEKKENVLLIAHPFVTRKGGKYFVSREDGSLKEITVGLQNEDEMEILSGADEREALILPSFDTVKF